MVFTTTSTRASRRARARGLSIIELLISTGLAGVVMTGLAGMTFYSMRSFAALTNYVELDQLSRNTLDVMSAEIRQADRLVSYQTNRLVFQTTNPTNFSTTTVTYAYNPGSKTLTRTASGITTTLLKECQYLQFGIFQRNPIAGTYDQYPVASASRPDLCKLVQLTWVCSRKILGASANTESVQSAKVVIRKQ